MRVGTFHNKVRVVKKFIESILSEKGMKKLIVVGLLIILVIAIGVLFILGMIQPLT